MVKRRAVGATMVAAVVFSALLVCDLAVYVASQDRAVLYSEGDASDAMYQQFLVLESAGGADVLLGAEAMLASAPLWCPTASSVVARGVAALSDVQASGGVYLSVHAEVGGPSSVADNLSALSPLEGSVPGDVNILLRFDSTGSEGPGVSFAKAEAHYVHLGLRLRAAVSSCEAAAAAVAGALSLPAANCSSGALGEEAAAALRSQARSALDEGFALSLSYSVSAAPACSVSFEVHLSQAGIQGLSSKFAVRFSYGWRVSVAEPASPGKG
ncbi:MAG: hypothetical protein JRM89_02250 [Nitrososphaerota archaeon]|jgi:hypothetical protein|nr:hypothetical protein [Nitrososphaerota archaeon]MDG6956868.1 hypothetical protein [Nitrososphaerota archaeon]MDG6960555.1 hypothetical protein [Nitrososphaerota archaeon]MDG6976148.1 hypothetical protein [Nitrososphaerota archaeon]MDG7014791.1 hypothetical protein [Nitrososphaerota archaeon]